MARHSPRSALSGARGGHPRRSLGGARRLPAGSARPRGLAGGARGTRGSTGGRRRPQPGPCGPNRPASVAGARPARGAGRAAGSGSRACADVAARALAGVDQRAQLAGRAAVRPGERGQALIELLGAVPTVLALALVVMQALAVGYSSVLAGTAAEAGALALVDGRDARAGAREALPGWSRGRARVRVRHGRVRVLLRPPAPLRIVARRLEVAGEAAVR